MSAMNAARIANEDPFCEADAAMDKVKESLREMLRRGAGLSEVAELMQTGGKTILLELTQSYVDMYTAQEQ